MHYDVLDTFEIVTIQADSDGFAVFRTRCNEDRRIDLMVAVEEWGHWMWVLR